MAKISQFEDIDVWKTSRELTKQIYTISKKSPFSKDFGLCDQIRRACIATMSNIAEGFERSGNKEFIQFLSIAKGSVGEVRSQLYIALDQKYITDNEFENLYSQTLSISKQIAGLIRYLKLSSMKGDKFIKQKL